MPPNMPLFPIATQDFDKLRQQGIGSKKYFTPAQHHYEHGETIRDELISKNTRQNLASQRVEQEIALLITARFTANSAEAVDDLTSVAGQ